MPPIGWVPPKPKQTNTGRLVLAYLRLAAIVFGVSVLIGAAVGIGWRLANH